MTVHFRSVTPENCPALVLNADFRPLSYYPLSVWCWQDAIKAVFLDRVNIVSEYDTLVRSPSFEMRLPSVVSLKSYIKPTRFPAFTRFNVFLRDRFTCQYCGEREDLTFDHVVPRSKGGVTTWENVVAACSDCNLKKADMLPAVARMWPATSPTSRACTICTRTAGCSRPTICTRAGWTTFTGTASWRSNARPDGRLARGRRLGLRPTKERKGNQRKQNRFLSSSLCFLLLPFPSRN